jgi:glycosyltransferase involved in cell wall biosynthesis
MKIVYLIPGMYNAGGMERVLTTMVNYLVTNWTCEIYIITTEQDSRPYFFDISPKIIKKDLNINFYKKEKENLFEKWFSRTYKKNIYKKRLTQALKEIKPDITVTFFGLDIDFINSIDDGSIKIGNMQFFRDFRSRFLNVRTGNPILRWDARNRNRLLEREAKKLTMFTVLTDKDREVWGNPKNIRTIPNPLPFSFKGNANMENKEVISVGRLSIEKGFDMLINAWHIVSKKHKDWKLTIYGQGHLEPALREQIRQLGLENSLITIHRWVNNIWEKYAASSIYVLCSRYEGLPTALIEAMSCGIPSVAFRCMNDPEDLISDGINGFLVEKENIEQLAEKIELLINSKEKRIEIGSKGRLNMQKYQVEVVMRQWIDLFEDVKINGKIK